MIARRNFNVNLNRPTIRNLRGPMSRPVAPRGRDVKNEAHPSQAPRDIGSILTLVLDKYNVNKHTAKIQTIVTPAPRAAVQQRFEF